MSLKPCMQPADCELTLLVMTCKAEHIGMHV